MTEALSSVEAPGTTATNDHAERDFELAVPWLGSVEVGNSGFRFVRVELADGDGGDVPLVAVRAISKYRDLPYLGSFRCSDERLNKLLRANSSKPFAEQKLIIEEALARWTTSNLGEVCPQTDDQVLIGIKI